MKLRRAFYGVLFVLLAACAPAVDETALETQIAGKIYATLTAEAPTVTPSPAVSATPSPTVTATFTPTPAARAQVLGNSLNLRDGPDRTYPSLTTLPAGTPLWVIGQYRACDWFKVRTDSGLTGWLKSGAGFLRLEGECAALPGGTFRPPTGPVAIGSSLPAGRGQLSVQNTTEQDAVVVLADLNNAPRAVLYLRAFQSATLTRIPDGSYRLVYSFGRDWEGNSGLFLQTAEIRRLEEFLAFSSLAGQPTVWDLKLGQGQSSPLTSVEIPVDDFPSIFQK